MLQNQKTATNESQPEGSILDMSLEHNINDRAQLQKELEKDISVIKKEIERHQLILRELKSKIQDSAVFETVEFFGKKITIVLEKNENGEMTNSEYLEFENINQRGNEINFYEWLKTQSSQNEKKSL